MKTIYELKEKLKYIEEDKEKFKLLWMWSKQGVIDLKTFIELNKYIFVLLERRCGWEGELYEYSE